MRIALLTTVAIACLCVAPVPSLTRGQVAAPTRANSVSGVQTNVFPVRRGALSTWQAGAPQQTTAFWLNQTHSEADEKRDREIDAATKRLRDADGSQQRAEARQGLFELLSKDYDARLETHAKELDRLEEKLDQMRARLEKRRSAKQDMIELRLKVLEAEANDLGWPARGTGNARIWRDRREARTGNRAVRFSTEAVPSEVDAP